MDIEKLHHQLESICGRAEQLESQFAAELAEVHPQFIEGARNLIHYMALRHVDIRELQEQLAQLGLSSLGRAERHVIPSVRTVQKALRQIGGIPASESGAELPLIAANESRLGVHVADLLGTAAEGRSVAIMVTLPREAGENYALVRDLVLAGMGVARINCAHDTSEEWLGMIKNVRRASDETESECKIVMDLAGPKLRTGELLSGPGVLRIRPRRDVLGRLVAPKRIRFIDENTTWPGKKLAVVPVPRKCIEYAHVGDEVRFTDTRGRKRKLKIIEKDANGLILEAYKRAYLMTGTRFRLVRKDTGEKIRFRIGHLPPTELPIVLRVGDTLILEKKQAPGEPAYLDADGLVLQPAHVSCRIPEIFQQISAGDPVHFNDGKIEGTIKSASESELVVEITQAKPSGSRLRRNRSINFPGSDLRHHGLTEMDRKNLEFIVGHADAVGLSFVSEPSDVVTLLEELQKHPECRLGVIPKIETERGFNALPRILLATMRHYPAGIMIARGDLAVECGWERLAEIQEEMLWLCEAAQLPVIWATQVLERKAKKGRATRAEITDAAMSQRADCVMLNKGPYILAAIRMLDDILRRMQNHQHKKTAMLRKLSITKL